MTDPARQGTPPEQHSTHAGQEARPDWQTFARSHEWRRAQAAASLAHAAPALQAALSALNTVQEDVRGRQYAAARRALNGYRMALTEVQGTGEAATLHSLAAPEALEAALSALDSATGEVDPAALKTKLQPAEAHPLTRAEAANLMGVLHALREEPEAARACFHEAVNLDAGHYRARMNLGNLALEAGDAAGAETLYREVLNLAPDYDGAHHNLAVALRRQGKVYESVGAIRRAQRLNVKRVQQEAREDAREQMRTDPRLRLVRNVVLGAVVLVVLLVFLFGRG